MGDTVSGGRKLDVFISYSHKDRKYRSLLDKHLTGLKVAGKVANWYDGEIIPGHEWAKEIAEHLNNAHIILLMISPDFIASDYCRAVEMARAMERHDAGKARVIPIFLRPCVWQLPVFTFGKLQGLPTDARPVTDWRNNDKVFANIAEGIGRSVEELLGRP